MNKTRIFKSATIYLLVLLFISPSVALCQQVEPAAVEKNNAQVFRPEELDQMLAPIALYPDTLLAQVLTAATYPVDIVAADRFVKENSGLKGEALDGAAKDKDWSPSVKAMLQFSDVLAMMDNQLEWTTKLGDAFLAQQREVMDSVQRLRQKAYAQGKLTNSKEQKVTADPQTQIIIVEPANPDIIYVPVYDPAVVYGPWWYPDYPPFYCYYPGFAGGLFLGGFAVSIGFGWRSWDCDWHHHDVIININNFNNFTRHSFARPARFQISGVGRSSISWQHNAQYRRGAGYRDYWTAQRFGGRQASNLTVRQNVSESQGTGQSRIRQSSPIVGVGHPEAVRPSAQRVEFRSSVQNHPSARPAIMETGRGQEGINAFSGIGRGGSERAASYRGQASFQSIHTFSNEGGSRGGGGGISRGGAGMGRSEGAHGGNRR